MRRMLCLKESLYGIIQFYDIVFIFYLLIFFLFLFQSTVSF